MSKIPVRVTLQPDGSYIWSAALNMDQERKGYTTAFTAVILLVTAGVSSGLNNWSGERRRT